MILDGRKNVILDILGCLVAIAERSERLPACLCADVAFEQKRKRRRLYREPSTSPVILQDDLLNSSSFSSSSSTSLLWKRSHHDDANVMSSCEADQRCKVRFLRLLGLEQVPRALRTSKLTGGNRWN